MYGLTVVPAPLLGLGNGGNLPTASSHFGRIDHPNLRQCDRPIRLRLQMKIIFAKRFADVAIRLMRPRPRWRFHAENERVDRCAPDALAPWQGT